MSFNYASTLNLFHGQSVTLDLSRTYSIYIITHISCYTITEKVISSAYDRTNSFYSNKVHKVDRVDKVDKDNKDNSVVCIVDKGEADMGI